MTDPISLTAATVIAKIVLDKFYEGAGKKFEEMAVKLGGAAVTQVNEKIQTLGNFVWRRCFKGKPKDVEQLPEQVAQGAESDHEKLEDYLGKLLDQKDTFAKDAEQLAKEIHQIVFEMKDITAENVQQNFDRQNTQVNAPDVNVYNIGDGSTVNFGGPPTEKG